MDEAGHDKGQHGKSQPCRGEEAFSLCTSTLEPSTAVLVIHRRRRLHALRRIPSLSTASANKSPAPIVPRSVWIALDCLHNTPPRHKCRRQQICPSRYSSEVVFQAPSSVSYSLARCGRRHHQRAADSKPAHVVRRSPAVKNKRVRQRIYPPKKAIGAQSPKTVVARRERQFQPPASANIRYTPVLLRNSNKKEQHGNR